MLKNMKIKASLIMTFGITILISVAIIVSTLFISMTQAKAYTSIIDNELAAESLIVKSRLSANIAARLVRNMALQPEDPGNVDRQNQMNTAFNDLSTYMQELREKYPLSNKRPLDAYTEAVDTWGHELPGILEAINSNNQDLAIQLIRNECTPALNQMSAAAEELNSLLETAKDDAITLQNRIMTITIAIIIAVMIVATIFVLILVTALVKTITVPTEQIRTALVGFSQGDLRIPVNYTSTNELGEMCEAMRKSQTILGGVIEDECYLLNEMANGNFNVKTKSEPMYVGALGAILTSIRGINFNLSDTLSQISQSAEQVSAGAEQVSTSAQALAQGATEQASAVEELSATINEIANNAKENAKTSEEVMTSSQTAGQQLQNTVQHMGQMVEAMRKISESSEEISKIVATIENIAFQTDILALNAAVEAARAGGAAGKGFAVVAAEVRTLASKSDQASKATKSLIERSIIAVKEGEDIVARVSDTLNQTIEVASGAVEGTGTITNAVEGEAESIAQIMEGIDQISSVVQTNSATSEESAAASEELASQASLMKQLMARFRLRNTDNVAMVNVAPASGQTGYESNDFGGSNFSGSKY